MDGLRQRESGKRENTQTHCNVFWWNVKEGNRLGLKLGQKLEEEPREELGDELMGYELEYG